VKYAFIQQHAGQYTINRLCKALRVSRSGYYDWRVRKPSPRELAHQEILRNIQALHTRHKQRYGSPRMHAALLQQGHRLSRGRVERIMHTHHIMAQRSKRHKRVYIQREQQVASPNILSREFKAARPNQKWVSDITFNATREGFLYLAIVLDIFSRAIVGWAMSQRINSDLVLDALSMAVEHRGSPQGVLVHSDQGSQYTAEVYRDKLAKHAMICSMSRKGECHDNAVAESFFHTLKEELIHETHYSNRQAAKQSIFEYIELYYNRQRLHSYLGYEAPLKYEMMHAVNA
jgi:putative transposase